jgi:hypothetical protein
VTGEDPSGATPPVFRFLATPAGLRGPSRFESDLVTPSGGCQAVRRRVARSGVLRAFVRCRSLCWEVADRDESTNAAVGHVPVWVPVRNSTIGPRTSAREIARLRGVTAPLLADRRTISQGKGNMHLENTKSHRPGSVWVHRVRVCSQAPQARPRKASQAPLQRSSRERGKKET